MMHFADNHLQCPICMEIFVTATILNCGHTFCLYCITEWRNKKGKACPMCRSKIKTMAPCTALDQFIVDMFGLQDQEGVERRRQFITERSEKNLGGKKK